MLNIKNSEKSKKAHQVFFFSPGQNKHVKLEAERVGKAQSNQAWVQRVLVDYAEQRSEDG